MTTIYLSSTYEDLKEHRQVIIGALRKGRCEVVNMEDYVASKNRPLDECLRDIRDRASIYVGIFAFRYGYIPPEEHFQDCDYTEQHDEWKGMSITELEYRFAKNMGKPCLIFVLKEGAPWNPEFIDAYVEREQDYPGQKIDRLRRELLQEQLVSEFTEPHELAILVQSAVAKQIQEWGTQNNEKASPQPEITWDIEKEGEGSPYPGLMHFTRRYAPVFFGREVEIHEILQLLHNQRCPFILVSGDSGVGKSSVVDAGVLPKLEETGLPDGQGCLCVRMVPSQGEHPFDALLRALHTQAEHSGYDPYAMSKQLLKKPTELPQRIKGILAKISGSSAMVVFLDQMEELFTSQAREHSDHFLKALFSAVNEGILWVIATIRSDHLHHCHRHPDLLQVLQGPGFYPLGPTDPIAMADMIRKPAQCAGLKITDQLVGRIVERSRFRGGKKYSEPVYSP